MSIYYRFNQNFITIFGQTYPHRMAIKALGGQFVGDQKNWRVAYTDSLLKEVDALCRSLGGGALAQTAAVDEQIESEISKFRPPLLVSEIATPTAEEMIPVVRPTPVQDSLSISELMTICERAVKQSFPASMWVVGEIHNFQNRRERGIYFDLSEQDLNRSQSATISVSTMIWADSYKKLCKTHDEKALQDILQDGMKVRVLCQVNFYKGRGSISLSVLDLDPHYTKGALALARERLLKELRQKGLTSLNKNKSLSSFPLRVGLISADGSRALSDFLHHLEERRFPGQIIFMHAAMQGESCPSEVSRALLHLQTQNCDLIVLTRGGGSAADLRWFDSSEIAYAVAQCSIPVIAAIGHHDDVCVAEEVCFERRKTPTAAADFIMERYTDLQLRLDELSLQFAVLLKRRHAELSDKQSILLLKLKSASLHALKVREEQWLTQHHVLERLWQRGVHLCEQKFAAFATALHWQAQVLLEKQNTLTQNFADKMTSLLKAQFAAVDAKIAQTQSLLQNKDPRPWIKQGWTQLWSSHQSQIFSVKQLAQGETLKARLEDGVVELVVHQVSSEEVKK